jgi:hypothetical protein
MLPPRARAPALYVSLTMYWPLLGGFIAFVLLAIVIGWIVDTSRRGDGANDGH